MSSIPAFGDAPCDAIPDSMDLAGPRGDEWYTGLHPTKCPGFVPSPLGGYLTSLPQISTSTTPKDLQRYFDNTWCMTEVLLGSLQREAAFTAPPYHDLRHPMIFYYGHPAALYVNKLRVAGLIPKGVDPYFEEVFETGVDEMSWDHLSKNQMAWPTVREVHAYRRAVSLARHATAPHQPGAFRVLRPHQPW